MCSRSTASIAILPRSGITNFFTSQRQVSTVRGLHRTWTCSTRYRSASSATVGAGAGLEASGSGSSPALMRAIIWVALARACSDVMTPWRPIATRFDFPPARVWTT